MKFRDVPCGHLFDFASGSYEGNLKISARSYLFEHGSGGYYKSQVGSLDVEVTNARKPHAHELRKIKEQRQ